MTDRILIEDLRFFAFHGVLPEETTLGQRFGVDIACDIELAEAGKTDDVDKTVNYGAIIAVVEKVVTKKRFKLIEALADAIAAEIFKAFPRILHVKVRVKKPEAPVQIASGLISVEIERSRAIG